ncbi:MAG: hypothetical protein COT89_02450 [Candidatus Colwellbacteria bacterium CG10_big_fil_rev_8_21_14_0_10_42_22]|uniref:Uncharacterized protein n=1 Tax=Candidatus Colwellbacteria bacterium CG10_big_fil_rev_8_21_14_0_10_42_22 TaxID=1974540 RepID=A0A2H0VFP4_9BACT|nr:MAG: hypothetical protein COT89_02450 [Candidatus Colwellbacteria bacterium CG10_big_fil_rev_8_21_14_0_10_42_22]
MENPSERTALAVVIGIAVTLVLVWFAFRVGDPQWFILILAFPIGVVSFLALVFSLVCCLQKGICTAIIEDKRRQKPDR